MKQLTVNDILNRVAISVGLDSSADAYGSTDKNFIQLRNLLQDSGDELVQLYPWEVLQKETNFTTTLNGNPYTLPTDFDRIIPGTAWDRAEDIPVGGPLNAQDWQYLLGRDLVDTTIYASFRQKEGSLYIFPDVADFEIYYEYVSTQWLDDAGTKQDEIDGGGNTVLFDGSLIRNYLRAKWYQAKGMDTVAPDRVASLFYFNRIAKDTNGSILNAGGLRTDFPYLDSLKNTPDTGYGT